MTIAIQNYFKLINELIDQKEILFDTLYYELWPLDIVIESQKLCIALDGLYHSTNPFQRQNDAIRNMEVAKQRWRVVRIRNC